ncbi:MAG: DUF1778 domain-containing protein [Candidatus Omnitrophota bacterium]|jgi:uncharacterized protein (DUF1778 family)|nr:MAG: DUF1778 domain-containing protein [Candidatus Omnitrophota bacterium]
MSQFHLKENSVELRDIKISIRAHKDQRDLIDSAAQRLGKSRSDFMLETACREAESILTDQRVFVMNKKEWNAFLAALDAPPKSRPRLESLMKERTVSEK